MLNTVWHVVSMVPVSPSLGSFQVCRQEEKMKEDCAPSSHVPISDSKSILKSELLNLLKTYNCYHEGKSFQLRHREGWVLGEAGRDSEGGPGAEADSEVPQEEGALVIEGLLNIAWGLRRPIRLQMQDDREPAPLLGRLDAGQPSCRLKEPLLQGGTAPQPGLRPSEHRPESASDSAGPLEEGEETPQLMRTKSDAACVIQRRARCRAPDETQRTRRHRFSINGHFYNHKTSVFTPAYGSVTNVRVNSTMTTLQVLSLLLSKFRVENGPSEFALYVVHESGGECRPLPQIIKTKGRLAHHVPLRGLADKVKDCEYPLISRILHGPSEKIARIFLMEADLGEEVPHDVAQYIKFEMPVLDSFIEKLKEEEQREIIKLTMKFQALRLTMLQRLEQLVEAK
ncbi:hypothetical protein QTO34_006229 [Cnephaeus nilssonii]|uniref:Ras association domain-containing protein 4 n=1 Tax=Cnephaeus nilssonii TaxID=3371016 RepID=A0AA40LHJ0_CNENI|nr:hypothetical protein QTO34_006229 [Eptesicus nilssonii]